MPFDDPVCSRIDRIPVRPVHWLWRPYLACGNPALLDGDPGARKSLLTADLAARLTRGGRMPDGAWRRKKANVLVLNDEDGIDDTLRPCLDAAGADLTLIVRRVSTRRARRRLLPLGQKRESEGASP
jgi:hypothetical protein